MGDKAQKENVTVCLLCWVLEWACLKVFTKDNYHVRMIRF